MQDNFFRFSIEIFWQNRYALSAFYYGQKCAERVLTHNTDTDPETTNYLFLGIGKLQY